MSKFPYYTATPSDDPKKQISWEDLPAPNHRSDLHDESGKAKRDDGYQPDDGLIDAVNVALLLNKPLLVTGEPGTGKTTLAYSIAGQLGFDEVLKFETKSSTNARDLFYEFDNLGRFHAKGDAEAKNYITFNALGLAIMRAADPEKIKGILPPDFTLGPQRRSLVLIDEIDKAPRDVPNDILNEIDEMYFRIPELKNIKVEAERARRPVVVLTSNSEKSLPEAFLRRCIYYNIKFPERDKLKEIVRARIGMFAQGSSTMLYDALDLFDLTRKDYRRLHKWPGTAELLDWLAALQEIGISPNASLRSLPVQAGISHWDNICKSTLFKNADDHDEVEKILAEWRGKKT